MNPELVAFLTSWSWEPPLLVGLGLAGGLYLVGWRRLCRQRPGCPMLASWRAWCFYGGLAALWLALLSPIAVFSELFFFMHMIQHLLLVLVAAPLLWLGAPLLPILWAFPRGPRLELGSLFVPGRWPDRLFGALTHPLMALALFVAAMAVWHLPSFYDAAQGRTLVHDLEHLVFLGAALLFWWPVIHPSGGQRRLSYAAAVPYFLPPMLEGNLIGALLTFADHPLYATYQRVPRVWGISVVQDQQLAGLIMWVPGGFAFIVPIFVSLVLLFRQEDRAGREESGEQMARAGMDDLG